MRGMRRARGNLGRIRGDLRENQGRFEGVFGENRGDLRERSFVEYERRRGT